MRSLAKLLLGITVLGALGGLAEHASEAREPAPHNPAPVLAVMDFRVPLDLPELAWAQKGLADLLAVELSRRGWMVVDRNSVAQLMSEIDFSEDIRAGYLLGASHVLDGRIALSEPGRIQISAELTSVTPMESTVSTVRTGLYPDGLDSLLQQIAEDFDVDPRSAPDDWQGGAFPWFPKPEALIFFYRGLGAYAEGYPEAAFIWFVNAYAMDPDLTAAAAWQIRSLESTGLHEMAAWLRNEWRHSVTSQQSGTGASCALTRPLMTPPGAWADDEMQAVSMTFRRVLEAREELTLVNPEGVTSAIREQDLQLSGFFNPVSMARYGHWQIPEGLVQTRFHKEGEFVEVRVEVVAMLSGESIVREDATIRVDQLSEELPVLLERAIDGWARRERSGLSHDIRKRGRGLPSHVLLGLTDLQQATAKRLAAFRLEEPSHENWFSLAESLRRVGHWELYAFATKRVIASIDLDSADADTEIYQTWSRMRHVFEWGLAQTTAGMPVAPLRPLEDALVTRFPRSPASGAVWYQRGFDAWQSEAWLSAVECMGKASAILEPECGISTDTYLSALYIKADGLLHLGRYDEAIPLLETVERHVKEHPGSFGSIAVSVSIDQQRRFVARGGVGHSFEARLADARRVQAGELSFAASPMQRLDHYLGVTQVILDESMRDFIFAALESLIDVWKTHGAIRHETWGEDWGIAKRWLTLMPWGIEEQERRQWFPLFLNGFLHREGLGEHGTIEEVPLIDLATRAPMIFSFCQAIELPDVGFAMIDRFLSTSSSPELASKVLSDIGFGAADFSKERINRETDLPGVLWIRLAHLQGPFADCVELQDLLRSGFSSDHPPDRNDELAAVLIRAGFCWAARDSFAAVRSLCAIWDILPWTPGWWHWFNEAGEWAAAGAHERAISCYGVALDLLTDPTRLNAAISIDPDPTFGAIYRDPSVRDYQWSTLWQQRYLSAKFSKALSCLILERRDEAARLLREVGLQAGQEELYLMEEARPGNYSGHRMRLGVLSADILDALHHLNEFRRTPAEGIAPHHLADRFHEIGERIKPIRKGLYAPHFFQIAEELRGILP